MLTVKRESEQYVYTLPEFLLLFAYLHNGPDYIFQQDHPSIHTLDLTAEFFGEQQVEVMT